jgi:hypothetical protein
VRCATRVRRDPSVRLIASIKKSNLSFNHGYLAG